MRKNPLPGWIYTVVALVDLALLIVIAVFFLSPFNSSTSSDNPVSLSRLPASPPVDQQITSQKPLTTSQASQSFDGARAYRHLLAQVKLGPRPTGSEAGWATGNFIIAELSRGGWSVETQEFIFKGVKGRNIIGKQDGGPPHRGARPLIIIGAHYDTRPAADRQPDRVQRGAWIDGANDGASGVAVLLELARVLEPNKLENEIWLVFLDAEDRGFLDGWPFSVGARHFADKLRLNPQSVLIVDMVGDADQVIYFERSSTQALQEEIWTIAAKLGYQANFIPEVKHLVIDDHVLFRERGIPAIDIIDFDYPYWHTTADTVDKVSPTSLERVGRTLEVWLEQKQ